MVLAALASSKKERVGLLLCLGSCRVYVQISSSWPSRVAPRNRMNAHTFGEERVSVLWEQREKKSDNVLRKDVFGAITSVHMLKT